MPYTVPSIAVPERAIQPSHPPLFGSSAPLQAVLLINAAQARAHPLKFPVDELTLGAQEPEGQPETAAALKLIQPMFDDHA
jgi:hypothetical protein